MIELDILTPFFADKQSVLEEILNRYPPYGRRSAIMPLLWEVQRSERHVSEARIEEIAHILGLHATEVKGVMTFYSTYHEQPVGRYHLQICSTLSCSLAGSDEMYDFLVEELDIVNGETDRKGLFSLQKVECLGSCGTAPVLQVNDTYYERVGRERCRSLIEALRLGEPPEPWRERGGDNEGREAARPFGGEVRSDEAVAEANSGEAGAGASVAGDDGGATASPTDDRAATASLIGSTDATEALTRTTNSEETEVLTEAAEEGEI